MIRRLRAEHREKLSLSDFKQAFREQFFMLLLDERRAVDAIPVLLEGHQDQGPELFEMIRKVATAGDPLGEEAERRLAEIEKLFALDKNLAPSENNGPPNPVRGRSKK
jgi:hypothetical protein